MKIDGIIKGLPWGSERASRLALDFARDFVSLFEQQFDGSWTCIGSAALSAPDFSKQIDGLRIEALVRDKHRTPVTLWLPEDQVLCRRYDLMDRHGIAAKAEALRNLAEDSPYEADELAVCIASAFDGQPVAVLAALRQTVIEATEYAEKWGFVPGTVSTRAYADVVDDRQPEFLLHETIGARAGRLARATAMATGALLAVSIGGLGAYHVAAPVLAPPTTVSSTAALDQPLLAEDIQKHVAYAPLGPTWIGQAQHLGFRTGPRGAHLHAAMTRQQVYARGADRVRPPELLAPQTQTAMNVGAIADSLERARPGRLIGEITAESGTAVAAIAGSAREELNLEPAAPTQADVETAPVQTAALAPDVVESAAPAREAKRRLPRGSTQQEPDQSDAVQQDPEANAAEQPQDEDAATEFAPASMQNAPASRPVELATTQSEETLASTDTEPARNDDADDERVDLSSVKPEPAAKAEEPTTDIAVTSQIGRSTPDSTEIASLGAPALSAIPGQRLAAPLTDLDAPRLDGSALAAVSAPRPLIRPRNLITIKPRLDQARSDAVSNAASRKLQNRPVAPRTIRAAANQHGLELGQASLIGVIEAQNGRKALVRLPTGDYRKVERGDVLDGWRVGTVGRETLRLTRRGQNRTLILVSR